MKLAIKIDVDNLRSALKGVPRLIELLQTQGAGASFLFSVGPDRSGRQFGRIFRQGTLRRLWRTRRIRDYGFRAYLYGTVLPSPELATRAAGTMRAVRDAGFEIGVRAYDYVDWCHSAARRDARWIGRRMELARSCYEKVIGEPPRVHASAGWQMNRYSYRYTQRLGYGYSSDSRGAHPFIPVFQGEIISCPQLPTTLPTFDELVTQPGLSTDQLVNHVLSLTENPGPWGHLFSANAGIEGLRLLPQFDELLRGWQQQGYELLSMHDYMLSIDTRDLPYHEAHAGAVPGRPGPVAVQGKEFLS